jgi:hypothetical protein
METRSYDPNEELRCPGCGEEKLRSDFYRRAASPENLSAHCKACIKQERRDWRARVKVQLEWAARCNHLVPELKERVAALEKQLAAAQAHHEDFIAELRLARGQGTETC